MAGRDSARPIVIKRIIEEGGHGHHGGAWKVAYADFVTAMMAFFLMLWLLSSSSEDTLKGLAEYFSEATTENGPPGGTGGPLRGASILPAPLPRFPQSPLNMQPTMPSPETEADTDNFDLELTEDGEEGSKVGKRISAEAFAAEERRREEQRFANAKAAIEEAITSNPELAQLAESLAFDKTPEGLRIQIIDRENVAMFPVGSDQMMPHTRKLLGVVASAIGGLPNKVAIRGHTDSRPFAAGSGSDNWQLSSQRANATRRALVESGLPPTRIAEVAGRADAEHLFPGDPNDPRNRRISMVLLNGAPPAPVTSPASTSAQPR